MRNEDEANRAINLYADSVRRICLMHLKNYSDTEDVFQDVFLKYILYSRSFENEEHEKAWILRVTINCCKDLLKSFFRSKVSSLDDVDLNRFTVPEENLEVLDSVIRLPEKYRDVIYLHYYEGYTAAEISKILNKKENTIYTWLSRAKQQLKTELGGETDGS